jgi:cyclin-dependent kinase 2
MAERYQKLEELGQGTYGIVYKAKDKQANCFVAIKKIRLEHASEGIPSTAMREIVVLKELDHPGVVELREVVYVPKEKVLHLIFEYLDYDMKKFMRAHKNNITETQIRSFVRQLLEAVDHCHSRRIIHRDIKPQNLLIDRDKNILKLADFGLARVFTIPIRTLTHEIETLWYRAPEILLGAKQYSLGVDMWAIGCVLAEFYLKKPLFMGDSEIDQIFKVLDFHGLPNEDIWPGKLWGFC